MLADYIVESKYLKIFSHFTVGRGCVFAIGPSLFRRQGSGISVERLFERKLLEFGWIRQQDERKVCIERIWN